MKTRNLIVLSLIGLLIAISSCRDDFDYDLASDNLSFSNDTINLDTIFNYTNSQTYKLTVHNNQNKDVEIPKIYLSRGESSFFKINVDGTPGSEFENIAVRKKDSIFIFIEIAAGEAPVNPLYEDEINFETTNGTQQVKLLSYIERAKFYIPEQGQTDVSITDSPWDNSSSRVIFGNAMANDLTITHGTKVYFHHDANLTVNGVLNVTGNIDNKVIFRTDRMDERSDSLPDMWKGVKIKSPSNSVLNMIDYAVIRGANIGLEVEDSQLNISNTKIQNNEKIGLYGKNSIINGRNLVINNADLAALGLEGGTYDFRHCTFANYFNVGQGAGDRYSLILSNDGYNLNQANFYNNIFYGISLNAIKFDTVNNFNFNYQFDYNVIRMDMPDEFPSGAFSPASHTLTDDPMFVESEDLVNDLRLLNDSPAKGHADTIYINNDPWTNSLIKDILGDPRPDNNSDLNPGAYQNLITP